MYMDRLTADAMSGVLGITGNSINVRINRMKQKFMRAPTGPERSVASMGRMLRSGPLGSSCARLGSRDDPRASAANGQPAAAAYR